MKKLALFFVFSFMSHQALSEMVVLNVDLDKLGLDSDIVYAIKELKKTNSFDEGDDIVIKACDSSALPRIHFKCQPQGVYYWK